MERGTRTPTFLYGAHFCGSFFSYSPAKYIDLQHRRMHIFTTLPSVNSSPRFACTACLYFCTPLSSFGQDLKSIVKRQERPSWWTSVHASAIKEPHHLSVVTAGEIPMSELVDSMQTLGFQDKNPLMFEIMLKISAKRKGSSTSFTQFAEDMADLIVSYVD